MPTSHLNRRPPPKDTARKKKRKDYAFRRQFNEKPSIVPGCPGHRAARDADGTGIELAAAHV